MTRPPDSPAVRAKEFVAILLHRIFNRHKATKNLKGSLLGESPHLSIRKDNVESAWRSAGNPSTVGRTNCSRHRPNIKVARCWPWKPTDAPVLRQQ